MRATRAALLTWIGCLALLASAAAQTAVGTAFTYQGRLTDGGSPASGVYDLQFVLYSASTGGSQVGPTVIKDDVTVTSGLFTAKLDFGAAAFAGEARFLEVGARPGASAGAFTLLTPRQELTPAPNAVFSQKAPWAGLAGVPAGFADGTDNDILGGLSCASGDIATWSGATWVCAAHSGHNHLGQTWNGAAVASGLRIQNTTPTGFTYGIQGESASTSGTGVFGMASSSSGSSGGVHGRSDSTAGFGVEGFASAATGTTYGVAGTSVSDSGRGVTGYASAATGTTYGVRGDSFSTAGRGVSGVAGATTGSTYGVEGLSHSTQGYGVLGWATATAGITYGVYGQTSSSAGSAVFGWAGSTTGTTHGVWGENLSTAGRAVYGKASASTGTTSGVWGDNLSTAGRGVYGRATASTGTTYGVYGENLSADGSGVYGYASATTGTNYGVYGESASPLFGRGVYGYASATTGTSYGVRGESDSTQGRGVYGMAPVTGSALAGYFIGNVQVTGTLSKGAGSFKIDHPLDPENKYLYHSFVESPDMKNVYDGNVTTDQDGYATVELPPWFEALNRDFRYQLTVLDDADNAGFVQAKVAKKIAGNRFTIRSSAPWTEVSWQVTGIRKDGFAEKHRIPVEQDKPEAERGLYLHPDAFGQPEEKAVDYQERTPHPRPAQQRPAEPPSPEPRPEGG